MFATPNVKKQTLSLLISVLFVFQPIAVAAGGVQVDSARSGNTFTDTSRSGVPIVNIATPNGNGVSHNTYIEFNVPTQGLILNNAGVETQTQTAGYIGGNRNVRNGSASLILNEVSGTNRSHIHGQMEVAGPSADVIVANPNGITVNGGGFINIPHATLTTAKVGFSNGRASYEVERGDILIEGKGLDATSTQELKLYTKALKLNAALHGNSIDVVTGINHIADDGTVTVKDSTGASRPAFSIDSTALGGIYANKIRLIGTQHGVGVNLPAEILAQESLQISSDGKIILGKVRVKNHASVRSHRGSIKVNEGIHANSLDLEALTSIALYGNSGAETNVWLKSDTLYNYGLLAAGVDEAFIPQETGWLILDVASSITNTGVLYGVEGIDLETAVLDNTAEGLLVGGDIEINASAQIQNAGEIRAGRLSLETTALQNSGQIQSHSSLSVDAERLNNTQGILESQGAMGIAVQQGLQNRSGVIYAGERLDLHAASLAGSEGSIIAKGRLGITITGEMDIEGGYLEGNGTSIQAGTISATDASVLSYGELILHTDRLDANHSSIQSLGGMTLTLTDALIQNNNSLLYSGGDIHITTDTFAHAQGSMLQSEGTLTLNSTTLDNHGSTMLASQVEIQTGQLDNSQGLIQSTGNSQITATSLDNTQGTLQANGTLSLILSADLNNTQGTLYSGTATAVQANRLHNEGGFVGSRGALSLDLETLSGDNGTLSGDGITIHTTTVHANNATIESTEGLVLNASAELSLRESALIANAQIALTAQETTLNGSTLYSAHENIHIQSSTLEAQESYMQAGTTLQIESTGDTDLSHATLKGQDITLSTPAHLEANGTDIVADASIRIDADSLDHREGQFIAGQDLNVTVAHTLYQDQSLWIAHRQLNAQSQTHSIEGNSTLYGAEGIVLDSSERLEVTEGSRLITDSNLTVSTDTLHLDNAALYAQQHAQITAAHITNRHHSSITSANAVIGTQTLDNADSNLSSAGGTLSIHTSDTLNNQHGLLSANGNLIITAQSLDTRNGEMEAGNTLDVTSAQMQIENSRFFAGNHLAVNSNISSIDAGTQFLSLNSMDLRFDGGLTNHGEITSNNIYGTETNITVQGDLNNEANITASGTLNIKANNLTNNLHDTNASIKGGGESTVILTGDLNNAGFLSSRGDLTLTAQNVTNTGGIATGRDLTIESHTLHNYNTLFSSRDMNLYIRDLLSNHEDAIIYAGQDLTIAKNAAGDKITRIENLAATIESGRDMNISAVTLENIGTVDINYTVNYYNTITEQNMTRAEMEAWIAERDVHKDRGGISNSFVNDWLRANGLYDRVTELHGNEVNYNRDGDDPNTVRWIEFITQVENRSSTTAATISSGNDAFFNIDNVTNRNGNILATHNMVFDVIHLDNTPSQISVDINHTTHVFTWDFDDGWFTHHTDFWSRYATPVTVDVAQIGGTSQILAGASMGGTIMTLDNGHAPAGVQVVGTANVDAPTWTEPLPDTTTQTTGAAQTGSTTTDTSITPEEVANQDQTPEATPEQSVDPLPLAPTPQVYDPGTEQITLPDNPYGLYVTNPDPSGPLIETNPEYTNYNNYVSSQYMLDRLGYDGEIQTRRLGDAMYETQLIRDAIIALTGQRFIGGATDDTQQYQALMDSGVNYANGIQLELGVAPTPEQLKLLKEDIVWLVEREVGGEKVLVPVLYLAHQYDKPNGANIHANSMDLTVTHGLNNSGSLSTRSDMTLRAGTLTNARGEIEAGGNMNIATVGDIKNLSGSIKGGSVVLSSREGDIVNQTLTRGIDLKHAVGTEHYTFTDKTASITATRGGMRLDAAKNIENIGADLTSKGSMALTAGNDVNIKTIKDERSYDYQFNNGYAKGESVIHTQSTIQADGLLDIKAGNDANLEAVKIQAGNTRIKADNRVNITAVVDSKLDQSHFEDSGFLSSSSSTDMTLAQSVKGTTIDTGTLIIEGKEGVGLESAQITAGNAASISSQRGDVDFTAASYTNAQFHERTSSFLGGLFSERSVDALSETKLADSATTAENQIVVKGENVNLTATDLTTAEGNIYLQAENKVTIQAGIESRTQQTIREKSGLFQGGHLWQMKKDETATYDETAKASTISAGVGHPKPSTLERPSPQTQSQETQTKAAIKKTLQEGKEAHRQGYIKTAHSQTASTIQGTLQTATEQGGKHTGRMIAPPTGKYIDGDAAASYIDNPKTPLQQSATQAIKVVTQIQEHTAQEETTATQSNGEQMHGTGSVIITAGSAEVIGSSIQAADHILVDTDVGSITITEAKEQHGRKELHEELNIDLTLGVKTGNGGVGITVASATYDKEALDEHSTTSASSTLQAGGTVQLTSIEDIKIQGSTLQAAGDVTLDAQGDVSITEAKDTMHSTTDETHIKAELSIGVKSEVAAAASAAKGLSDATKALQQANRALSKYKKKLAQYKADYEAGIISPEDYQEAKEDLKYYQLNVAMAIKNEASAAKNAASAAKGLAASGVTGGLSGGITLDVEGSKTHSTAEATSSTASQIIAGNDITIRTGKTLEDGTRDTTGSSTTIQGSHLNAGSGITVDTGDLSITASRDTTRSNSSTTSMSASVTFGTGGVTGGSIGGGFSKDRSKGTTYTNATLNANTLTLNTSGDASIRGATLHTTEATTLNIGGDLEVASLQDRNSHNSVGIDASIGFSTDTNKQGDKTGQTTTASANYNSSNGNYIAVTNQTSITSDGTLNIDTKGNTHLAGALIEGETATSITTATLTTEDIHNRADYNAMSVGATLTHSTSPDKAKDNGISPNIGLPQDIDKSSTTHTAIAANTQITITDKDKQTQDTDTISRDTEHASYTMTEINTEVLDIRAGISQDLSKDGFKAVGDLAMREGWEDGSTEKTLAHAAMGAVVAGIGNGDALGGALGAGAAEAARPATADANDATQQSVSALVGAIAGGGTGASVGLDGEKYNRQLHQREIAWLKDKANIQAFMEYYQITMGKTLSLEDAARILAQGGAALVDKSWHDRLGNNADVKEAQDFIKDTYTDKSAIFYDDPNSPVKYGTHAFNPDAEEYKDRYANLGGFIDNKDFYRDNLNLGTGKGASAGDYVSGAVQPIKDLGNALYNDPLGTLQATGEGIIDPMGSGLEAGSHMAELEEMAQLDGMMGDDTAAAQHRGEAYGGIAAAAITRGTIKTITRLRGGRVRVELEGGQSVEVPEGSIVYHENGIISIDGAVMGRHGTLKNHPSNGQSHHLNQDAAYRDVIPTNDAIAVKAEGNAFTDINSPHYNAHESLESFWNTHRANGTVPTNLEYSRALKHSLENAGYTPTQIAELVRQATRDRVRHGQLGGEQIPRVPGRIPQRPRGTE